MGVAVVFDMAPDVKAALLTVCDTVVFHWPETFGRMPCISYCEMHNGEYRHADDAEYLSEIHFTVDIWAKTGAEASALAAQSSDALRLIGFSRQNAHDLRDISGLRRKNMLFKTIR